MANMIPTEIDKSQLASDFGYTLKTLSKRLIPIFGIQYYKSVRKFGLGDLIKIFQHEGCPPKYDSDWIIYKRSHAL